jgi:hypothetical protein
MNALPAEIHVEIFQYLDLRSYLNLSRCNKYFNSLAQDDCICMHVRANSYLDAFGPSERGDRSHKDHLRECMRDYRVAKRVAFIRAVWEIFPYAD